MIGCAICVDFPTCVHCGKARRWASAPHAFGPGKIHLIDNKDTTKSVCGYVLTAIGGEQTKKEPDCKRCLDLIVRRPAREKEAELRRQQYEAEQHRREQERAQQRREYRAWYHQYLHHTTYDHIGNEFLWELRAICRGCHQRVTELDKASD